MHVGLQRFDPSVLFWAPEGRAHSKSAIIHFSAVLGIDNHKGCYRLHPIFGQVLATLLVVSYVLAAYLHNDSW